MNGRPDYLIVAMMLVIALPACVSEQRVRLNPVSAPVALEPGQRRGIIKCVADRPCGAPARSTVATPPSPVSANDVAIDYLKVGSDGRLRQLQNGSTMAPGERFAIRIDAHRDAHVYLWHRDPQGRVTELLGTSGVLGSRDCSWSNRLRAGQVVELSAPGTHYTQDAGPGTVRIQPLVSSSPLCGPGDVQTEWLRTGTGADCADANGRCGEVFVIHHLRGA